MVNSYFKADIGCTSDCCMHNCILIELMLSCTKGDVALT